MVETEKSLGYSKRTELFFRSWRSMHRQPMDGAMPKKSDLMPGTLDMMILKTLTRGPQHGYGIASSIKRASDDVLTVEEGSLYPALQRLLLQSWVKAEWRSTDTNRRARFYTLTPAGRKQLGLEQSQFETMIAAIGRVMQDA
jgi:PadR family transcriptional regulator, regulatory protein PadR